jgi:lysozyme
VKTSANGLDFIRREEGVRLTAYRDAVGVWTIGVGHTLDVKPGRVITMQECDELLRKDLEHFEQVVDRCIKNPQVTQGQFDAMVSLCFNIGAVAFASSTLVKRFNLGDVPGAGSEFARWVKAGGVFNDALAKRRGRELWAFAKASPP